MRYLKTFNQIKEGTYYHEIDLSSINSDNLGYFLSENKLNINSISDVKNSNTELSFIASIKGDCDIRNLQNIMYVKFTSSKYIVNINKIQKGVYQFIVLLK